MKILKKLLVNFLSLVLIMCSCLCNYSYAEEIETVYSIEMLQDARMDYTRRKMSDYILDKWANGLIISSNYGYMNFVSQLQCDAAGLYFLNMSDMLINFGETNKDTAGKPDKIKYEEVLINIITTYELDIADSVYSQYKMDNLKSAKDYAIDFADIATTAVGLMSGLSEGTNAHQEILNTIIDVLDTEIHVLDNQIEGLSRLETVIQDYSENYEFLALVAQNSGGELRSAALELQSSMSKAFEIKLNTYLDIEDDNFQEYSEFMLDNVFWNVVKETEEYKKDDTFRFFMDSSQNIVSKALTIKDSFELGVLIGKTVGNFVVGGENVINRVKEMVAISEISSILSKKILDQMIGNEEGCLWVEYQSGDYSSFMTAINEYVMYSKYLAGCRIRGEYCLYSMYGKEIGLLSTLSIDAEKDADEAYKKQSQRVMNIYDKVDELANPTGYAVLHGTVNAVSDTGEKYTVSNANVRIMAGEDVIVNSLTNEKGEYLIFLDPGNYTIEVSIEGYEPDIQEIEVKEDGEEDIQHQIIHKKSSNEDSIDLLDDVVGMEATYLYSYDFDLDGDIETLAIYQYENEWGELSNCQIWYQDEDIEQLFIWEDTSGNAFCNVSEPIEYYDSAGNPYIIVNTYRRVAASYLDCMILGLNELGEFDIIYDQHAEAKVIDAEDIQLRLETMEVIDGCNNYSYETKNVYIENGEVKFIEIELNVSEALLYQKHTYMLFDDPAITTWEEAKEYCEQLGGQLAIINSAEENEALYQYMISRGHQNAYFGFSDTEEEGKWVWVNGEVSSYTNWHNNEPNQENTNEDYAMFYYKYTDGTWNDGDFGNRTVGSGKAFICEWNYEMDLSVSDDYILPTSSTAYLTEEDLKNLTADELRLARNEIYARHGRIFTTEDLNEYFNSKSWYTPVYEPEEFDQIASSLFNEYEVANLDLIVEAEK